MAGMNKVLILGRLGRDPEIKYTGNGDPICNFSVATSEDWKDKNTGEKKSKTEWHSIVVFGKSAEACGKFLNKGSQVYVEGKLQTRKWEDKDGVDRYKTEIVVNLGGTVQFLDSKPKDKGGYQKDDYGYGKPQETTDADNIKDDDIPF